MNRKSITANDSKYCNQPKRKTKNSIWYSLRSQQFARQPLRYTVNCAPKLAVLAKVFDASFDRKHEARCARRTIWCSLRSHTDKWSLLLSKFAQKVSNWPHCHSQFTNNTTQPFQLLHEAIYVEYRMSWLIFEIAKYGSWTKCCFFFHFFQSPPLPPLSIIARLEI